MSEEAVQRLMGLVDAWAVAEGAAARRVMPGGGMLARRALESALREVLKQPLGDASGPGSSLQPQAASTAIPIADALDAARWRFFDANAMATVPKKDGGWQRMTEWLMSDAVWEYGSRAAAIDAAMAAPTPQEPKP